MITYPQTDPVITILHDYFRHKFGVFSFTHCFITCNGFQPLLTDFLLLMNVNLLQIII